MEGDVSGFFRPTGLNSVLSVFLYSIRVRKVDISTRTIYHWKRPFVGFLKVYSSRSKLGFTRNLKKCNSDFTKKSRLDATVTGG